jgi:hypothetical protein
MNTDFHIYYIPNFNIYVYIKINTKFKVMKITKYSYNFIILFFTKSFIEYSSLNFIF